MGLSWFLKLLLVSMLLLLSFSPGFGRKLMEPGEFEAPTAQLEEFAEISRETIEIMDYKEPGANVNPRAGYLSPPPQG